MNGAGSVGGLLELNSRSNGIHFDVYDGNGNVAAQVSAADGSVSANYDYSPFGERLRTSGLMINENVYGFSTKRYDTATDFIHYEYRTYKPNIGAWLCRDPLEEIGGRNLYAFVFNNPLKYIDTDGRVAVADDVAIGIVAGGLTVAGWLASPAGQQWLKDTGKTFQQAFEELSEAIKNLVRRCLPCSRRHPTWPKCTGSSDPVGAVIASAPGLYPGWSLSSTEVRDEREADPQTCPSGGKWNAVKAQFFTVIETGTVYHEMSVSVVCCNCCYRWFEGKVCRVIHPGRGSGGTTPPPPAPPFQGQK